MNKHKSDFMRIFFFFFIVGFLLLPQLHSQPASADKQQLYKLLQERKEKFDAYAASLEKHSGIFGNKTKKDMQQSNAVLTEIVKTDNEIISVLNRTLDFKDFEKTNLNYSTQSQVERAGKLLHSVDTLQKQVQVLKYNNRYLNSQVNRTEIILFFAVSCAIILLIILLLKLKSK